MHWLEFILGQTSKNAPQRLLRGKSMKYKDVKNYILTTLKFQKIKWPPEGYFHNLIRNKEAFGCKGVKYIVVQKFQLSKIYRPPEGFFIVLSAS